MPNIVLFLTMEAKREEIIASFRAEMSFPQIPHFHRAQFTTVKNSLKGQGPALQALRLERSKKLLHTLKKKAAILLLLDKKMSPFIQPATFDRFIYKKNVKDVPDSIQSFQKLKHLAQVMVFGLIAPSGEKMPSTLSFLRQA